MRACMNPSLCGVENHRLDTDALCMSVQRVVGTSPSFGAVSHPVPTDEQKLEALLPVIQRGEEDEWLRKQWDKLNVEQPPCDASNLASPQTAQSESMEIDTRHVISHDGYGSPWGEVNNRPESYGKIMRGISAGYQRWFEVMSSDTVRMQELTGPEGSLYHVGSGGRHRTAVAKAMGLSRLPVIVSSSPVPQAGDRVHVRLTSQDWALYNKAGYFAEGQYVPQGPPGSKNLIPDSVVLAKGLGTSWELGPAEDVAAISRAYARIHPESTLEPHMMDAETWRSHLRGKPTEPEGPISWLDKIRGLMR